MDNTFNGFELPDLNNPEVRDVTKGPDFFGDLDFGDFDLQILRASFEVGKRMGSTWFNKVYAKVEVRVLAAVIVEPPAAALVGKTRTPPVRVGELRALAFLADKSSDVYAQRKLSEFVRAVDKAKGPTKEYDAVQGLKKILTIANFEPHDVRIRYRALPNEKKQDVKHPLTGKVIETVDRVYRNESFTLIESAE